MTPDLSLGKSNRYVCLLGTMSLRSLALRVPNSRYLATDHPIVHNLTGVLPDLHSFPVSSLCSSPKDRSTLLSGFYCVCMGHRGSRTWATLSYYLPGRN